MTPPLKKYNYIDLLESIIRQHNFSIITIGFLASQYIKELQIASRIAGWSCNDGSLCWYLIPSCSIRKSYDNSSPSYANPKLNWSYTWPPGQKITACRCCPKPGHVQQVESNYQVSHTRLSVWRKANTWLLHCLCLIIVVWCLGQCQATHTNPLWPVQLPIPVNLKVWR